MKKILARFVMLLTIGFTFLNGSCDKDSDPGKEPGPSLAVDGPRLLCTIGLAKDGQPDTLVYSYSTTGGNMHRYVKGLTQETDKIELLSQGSGSNVYHIAFKKPYQNQSGTESARYLGIDHVKLDHTSTTDDFVVSCDYRWTPKGTIDEDIKMIIVGAANGFTIESKSHPGYYLRPEKWRPATYPGQTYLTFCADTHPFFLLEN